MVEVAVVWRYDGRDSKAVLSLTGHVCLFHLCMFQKRRHFVAGATILLVQISQTSHENAVFAFSEAAFFSDCLSISFSWIDRPQIVELVEL
jgi:hypothetical protein